jgi:hypothetical protein
LGEAQYAGVGENRVRVGNNIFMSPDALTNEGTLCIILQGSGAVRYDTLHVANSIVRSIIGVMLHRPGQWARALCINESLTIGSILPYLTRCAERKWATIVLNPNQTSVQVKGSIDGKASSTSSSSSSPGNLLSNDRAPGGGFHLGLGFLIDAPAVSSTTSSSAASDSKALEESYAYFRSSVRSGPPAATSVKIRDNETSALHTTYVWLVSLCLVKLSIGSRSIDLCGTVM